MIKKVRIKNFKIFKDITIDFNENINILVGNNGTGKSTIIEAINLALTGLYKGKPLYRSLNQYLFNYDAVYKYLKSFESEIPLPPPEVHIELFLDEANDEIAKFIGDNHSLKNSESLMSGISYKITLDKNYQEEYQSFIELSKQDSEKISTLPIEYYGVEWSSFARDPLTSRKIPLKTSFIDIGNSKSFNGSDIYISRIVQNIFDEKEKINISQAYRKIKEEFNENETIELANEKIKIVNEDDTQKIELSVNLNKTWEDGLITEINSIPFDNIGKGEQSMIKTKLSLSNKQAEKAAIILIEEPESHISHSNLNKQLDYIKENLDNKQIFITTHSSFVSNKLGLKDLILLSADKKTTKLTDLSIDTQSYFKKIAGYDTLRLILARKSILVEGDSDELIIQKAYYTKNNKLPIEDAVEVISVGTSFKRFLEIAVKLNLDVEVVTDHDGDLQAINRKYNDYDDYDNISIHTDDIIDERNEIDGVKFNFNTLEPIILRDNGLHRMNKILDKSYSTESEMLKYMNNWKTDCALKIFDYEGEDFVFPSYIVRAVKNEK